MTFDGKLYIGLICENPGMHASYNSSIIFPQKWQLRPQNENFEISWNSG